MSTRTPSRLTVRSFEQMGPGPFSELHAEPAGRLLALGEMVMVPGGRVLVDQYHRADLFYLLLQGEVEFALEVDGQRHAVGRCDKPWTPIGWSGFRSPYRYATSVSAARSSELLRFRTDELVALFDGQPELASVFFQALADSATSLLGDVRERLLTALHSESSLRHWTDARQGTSASVKPDHPESQRAALVAALGPMPGSEAMVTNAAPEAHDLLYRSPFFRAFPDQAMERIAREASTFYFCRGDVLAVQGGMAEELLILAEGMVRLEYRGTQGTTVSLRSLGSPGQILGFCLLDTPRAQLVTLRAVRDGAMLRVPREALRHLFAVYPEWGRLYGEQLLWLISRQLQGARAHLIGESFDQEFLAIDNLIEQNRTQLAVSSALHKVPHLLRSAMTLGDALGIVDAVRGRGQGVEAHVAELCHELLSPVRREQRFFSSLQEAFEQVVSASPHDSPEKLRRRNAETFIKMFSQIPSRIEGLRNLPERPGNIFIFNHLRNHECNSLPNGFQLTLDSHFISSMVLHRHYGDPGVRVVRRSRAAEYGHQDYYNRLGHVAVYTRESDEPQMARSDRVRCFIETAGRHLREGTNIVLAPEGTSSSTEESPGPFKAGAFWLASSLSPEPWIVPIAVANFDRRLDRAVLALVIDRPWKVSERIQNPEDAKEMQQFLRDYREEYRHLVVRAQRLAAEGLG